MESLLKRLAVVSLSIMFLSGCTGVIRDLTLKDTYWTKPGTSTVDLTKDYGECRGEASRQYATDVSAFKSGAIHSAALNCLRYEKDWAQIGAAARFIVPKHDF